MTARRLSIVVRGIVQGIGFRPSVAVAARALGLAGTIRNTVRGVTVDVEGRASDVEEFRRELLETGPLAGYLEESEIEELVPTGRSTFDIVPSTAEGERAAWITPDLATCPECTRELFDPDDFRHRYPFLSCARCGPRYTIYDRLPFDRENTVMVRFPMCDACRAEYEDPADRRYHAQTISCPACGPRLELVDAAGTSLGMREEALRGAAEAVRAGRILALMGLGGFQLLVDATNGEAVAELRRRKRRPAKPFAVMFESLAAAEAVCEIDPVARGLLDGPQSPIVLLPRRAGSGGSGGGVVAAGVVAAGVAPDNPNLGVMIPYTPLHHLLLRESGAPVVATSGNVSGDPICIAADEARERLGGIADVFLVHDRPIRRPVDDTVVRIASGRPLPIRIARGISPLSLTLAEEPREPGQAVGGHLKNTIALTVGRNLVLSQHVGELDAPASRDLMARLTREITEIYEVEPAWIARDLHPDYASTHVAIATGKPAVEVQHHHAHVVSAMMEHGIDRPVLGIVWDGTGFGPDGTIWGGEFLRATRADFERVARLRPFPLPGGEAAIREPRRAALGALWALDGPAALDSPAGRRFEEPERRVLGRMLERGINAPVTSAAGRLWDAAASLLGLRQVADFEGQAAMDVEFAASRAPRTPRTARTARGRAMPAPPPASGGSPGRMTSGAGPDGPWVVDWERAIRGLVADAASGADVAEAAARFQTALVAAAVEAARRIAEPVVVLTGGCFQNRLLVEDLEVALRTEGFEVITHRRVPPNDGGLSVGQLGAALARRRKEA